MDTNTRISSELGEKSAVHEVALQELKVGLAASASDRGALQQCLDTNIKISSELSKKSIAHETVIQELKADLAAGRAATASLQNSIDTSARLASDLSNKSFAQSSAIQDLQAELAAGKAESVTFQKRLDSNAKVSSDLSAELCVAKSAIEANQASIEDLKNDVSARRGESLELKSLVDAQRSIVQSLEERCSVLAAADSCFEGRFETLEREMATAEKEMATIQECLEKHNEDLSAVTKASANLTDKADFSESQAHKLEDALKRLEPEVNRAHVEIAGVLDTLSKHGTSITSISEKHAEICEATRDLGTELAAAKMAALEVSLRVDAEEEATKRFEQYSKTVAETTAAHESEIRTELAAAKKAGLEFLLRLDAEEEATKRLEQHSKDMAETTAVHESEIKLRSVELHDLEKKLAVAECERLAELKVVCTKVEQQQVEIQSLSSQVRTQLRAARQAFGRSLDEVRDGLSAKLTEASEATEQRFNHLESELAARISCNELEHTNVALHQWVNETRDALSTWLHTSLDNFRRGQNATLLNHQGWVKSVTGWIKQVHVREQGLSHVLLHVLQDGKPELVKLMEDALRMPRVPNLESPSFEDAAW
eukprot:TRINITY_DN3025_c0_g1_i4.p1 TRINITY_DN3025_c0_g1~~TRINITY_DN3025_c0_g1_i4.p1  ORF type:complete len:599 (+),score=146.72 TRINITY_DN3025_c0_g1_i4:115-1911(+)